MHWRSSALLVSSLIILISGCGRSDSPPMDSGAASAEAAAPVSRLSQREFFRKVSIEAYLAGGHRNPKWDAAVTNFLVGRVLGGDETSREQAQESAWKSLQEAENAGCDDPLVRYLALRWRYDPAYADTSTSNLWVEAAVALEESSYPTYWKFFGNVRASQAVKAAIATSKNTPMVHGLRRPASSHLVDLATDASLPAEVMFEAADTFVNQVVASAPGVRNWTYENVEPNFKRHWGDTAEYFCFKGRYEIKHAWDARGSGFADTVTEDGWKLFHERLRRARQSLEESWKIKPMEAAATAMLTVELGDTTGRRNMELWFDRAMELNPANYAACEAKLTWLLPKWHGDPKAARAFGLECVNSTAWKGNVPLILKAAHEHLARQAEWEGNGTREDYLARPSVWNDIQLSYERFFELNPEAVGWRHNYALAAYRANAWKVFLEQVKLLDDVNYRFFGGKEKLEEMVIYAEKRAQ